MGKDKQCDAVYRDSGEQQPPTERYALAPGKTLVLIPCGDGAYNFSTVAYVVSGGGAELAKFDYRSDTDDSHPQFLINAGWDEKTGELTSHYKGRGVADCGTSETYVWDGTRFRLVEARSMDSCRGVMDWPRVWHAEAVKR